jgi:RhtB (resistance to homoserine/threonine) family protein
MSGGSSVTARPWSPVYRKEKEKEKEMPQLQDWLTIVVIGCLAVIAPGPNLAIVLRNSLVYSRRAGVYTAVGLAMGNLVHATYCLIGIGVIITQSILLFNTVKWLGAAYLIYIGIKSLQAKKQHDDIAHAPRTPHVSVIAALRTGFLTNLLNPKVTLFFLALFTQIIQPGTLITAQAIYGLTMVGLEFLWFALVAALVSQSAIKQRFLAVSHWIERATGAVLIALGLRIALAQEPN